MLVAGFWIQGSKINDAGVYSTIHGGGKRVWSLDAGCWMLARLWRAGCCSDFGGLVAGERIQVSGVRCRGSDAGFWMLDAGFWMLAAPLRAGYV